MSENENRNCKCSNTNNKDMNAVSDEAIVALNNPWDMDDDSNMCGCSSDATREEMLHQIKCLAFGIQELALYLDTHPNDEKALCLHNKYCKEYRELTDKYQKIYGPLTIHYPCNKWRWIEEPWPWEGGMN